MAPILPAAHEKKPPVFVTLIAHYPRPGSVTSSSWSAAGHPAAQFFAPPLWRGLMAGEIGVGPRCRAR